MRFLPLCATLLIAASGSALADPPAGDADEVQAVQRRPLREARRLELLPYGSVSVGDPYLQRWGVGLRAMWHAREGLSLGLDASGFATYATQELVIAKRELHARIIESRQRAALAAVASIAPLYGKVALPGDALVHFETFFDAGLGGALTETDAGRGLRPMLIAGVGQRISLSPDFALTGRVGGNVYAEREVIGGRASTKAVGFWTVSLGLSVYLPGARDR